MATLDRIIIPASFALFAVFALAVPTLRHRRRTGENPLVLHRVRSTAERIIGVSGVLLAAAIGVLAALIAFAPERVPRTSVFPPSLTILGWLLLASAQAVVVIAQIQMGSSWRVGIDTRATPLVTTGLYRHVRNPIYTGVGLLVVGLALSAPSVLTLALTVGACMLLSVQTRLEERHLLRLHGPAFVAYAARVPRFVPWPSV
jgi:protein-S-isoprenylcysteine O-methyltransferase Ste14